MRRALVAPLMIAGAACPSLAATLTPKARAFIDDTLLQAKFMSATPSILRACREAEAKAAEFDPDPFYDGAIAECLAFAQAHLHNEQAACSHRARALQQLRSVGPDHPSRAKAAELISGLRDDVFWSRC